MNIIRAQLEGLPMTKIVEKPEVAKIINRPGFWRDRKDAPKMTPKIAFQRTIFISRAVLPIIRDHSPVLYAC